MYLSNYLYQDGPAPPNMCEADVNGDGTVWITDLPYLVNFMFFDEPDLILSC